MLFEKFVEGFLKDDIAAHLKHIALYIKLCLGYSEK